jgi:branched-chain amino acid transport system substrate-binding protein
MLMFKRFIAIAALCALCSVRSPAVAAEPYDVNVIVSLTGIAAFIGKQEADALHALEPVVNRTGGIHGRPVHFVMVDDASTPATSVQLANQIIARQAPVILGPSLTADCAAVMAAAKAGPVVYCFAPSVDPPAGSFGFSSGVGTASLTLASIRYLAGHGWKRIALISSTDATGQHGEELIKANLRLPESRDITLVADEHFATADVSVAAQVARIKAANPQAIIAWTTGTPTGTVLRNLHDAGLDVPVLLNAGNIVRSQILQYSSFLPTDLVFTGFRFMAPERVAAGPIRLAQSEFTNALKAQNISPPEISMDLAWDAARVVVDALRHVPEHPTAADVKTYIEQLHGFAGTNSLLDFRDGSQRGVSNEAVVIVKWNAAKQTLPGVSGPGGRPLPVR